jgi:hypothetical protein
MPTQGKYNFDYVPINPQRERAEPIPGDGISVGTIRSAGFKPAETVELPCEKCGQVAPRTLWQAENGFHCYNCSHDNKRKVDAERV